MYAWMEGPNEWCIKKYKQLIYLRKMVAEEGYGLYSTFWVELQKY